MYTCHKVWTEIYEINQNFQGAKNSVRFSRKSLWDSPQNNQKAFISMLETCDKHNSVIYDYIFIKCVFRQSENSVRFENLKGIGFQTGQIL